jgi:RNA recognition motif-containing protein
MDVNMPRDKSTGKSKGFAFLMYEDQRSTVLAVDNLNGAKVRGRTLKVDHVKDYKQPKVRGEDGEFVERDEQSLNAKPELILGALLLELTVNSINARNKMMMPHLNHPYRLRHPSTLRTQCVTTCCSRGERRRRRRIRLRARTRANRRNLRGQMRHQQSGEQGKRGNELKRLQRNEAKGLLPLVTMEEKNTGSQPVRARRCIDVEVIAIAIDNRVVPLRC